MRHEGMFCAVCEFYWPTGPTPGCRRYPKWESRLPGDWCGEWRPSSEYKGRPAPAKPGVITDPTLDHM